MTQKYITWNPYWKSENQAIHPTMEVSKLWPLITLTQLPYGNNETDKRMLAIGSYDENIVSGAAWDRFLNNFSHYCFYETTPGSAVALCNEWYNPPSGSEFALDEDTFTIVCNWSELQ